MKKSTSLSKIPSLTKLRQLLQRVTFNPREMGPTSLISDVWNVDYYIMESVQRLRRVATESLKPSEKVATLIGVIRLLILATLYTESSIPEQGQNVSTKTTRRQKARVSNPGSDSSDATSEGLVRDGDSR